MAASTVPDPVEAGPSPRETSLLRWVWRTYVRNALVPLLVVELLLVAVYITSHAWSLRRNVAALTEVARQELARIADDEANVIEQQLGTVSGIGIPNAHFRHEEGASPQGLCVRRRRVGPSAR